MRFNLYYLWVWEASVRLTFYFIHTYAIRFAICLVSGFFCSVHDEPNNHMCVLVSFYKPSDKIGRKQVQPTIFTQYQNWEMFAWFWRSNANNARLHISILAALLFIKRWAVLHAGRFFICHWECNHLRCFFFSFRRHVISNLRGIINPDLRIYF